MNDICENCQLNDICKYYKIIKRKNIKDYVFPDFITVIIENKQAIILDCKKYKPFGVFDEL